MADRNSILESRIVRLTEVFLLARHRRFGRTSQKSDLHTLAWFDEIPASEEEPETDEQDTISIPAHVRKKGGREPLDPNREPVDIVLDIPESKKHCKGSDDDELKPAAGTTGARPHGPGTPARTIDQHGFPVASSLVKTSQALNSRLSASVLSLNQLGTN